MSSPQEAPKPKQMATTKKNSTSVIKSTSSTKNISNKEDLAVWRQKEKDKYDIRMALKEASGEPSDNHLKKWRGPKGARYRGYGKTYNKISRPKKHSGPFALLTDCPLEIILKIAAVASERDINALARCNSRLYEWLNSSLYEKNIESGGSSALFWAASKGNKGTIKKMINFGVDLHSATNPSSSRYLNSGCYGRTGTALHVAVYYDQFEMITLLVKQGLGLEQRTSGPERGSPGIKDLNCLELAMERNNPSLAMFLIKKGADVNATCTFRASRQRLIDQVLSYCTDEFNILMNISRLTLKHQIHWLQMLLQMGADVNPIPHSVMPMESVFDWACNGFPERVPVLLDLLFEYGADVNSQFRIIGPSGATPLHVASFLGLTETVEDLISRGANIEARDEEGRTPLFWAVSRCYPHDKFFELRPWNKEDCVGWEDLMSPEEFDKWQRSSLRWEGSVEIVRLLLEHGADPEVEGPYHQTPQASAAENTNNSFRTAFKWGLVGKKKEARDGMVGDSHGADDKQNHVEQVPALTDA